MPLDDEMTELVDADFPRVDLVGRPANGSAGFLVMKQDATAGLLDPGFVRDLIAKEDAVTAARELPNGITLAGSPAAMAAFIHAASVRKAGDAPAAVAKAKYSADQLKAMGAKGHAFKNPDGSYSYPIGDDEDLGNAVRAVGRGGADHDAIRRYVIRRAKALGSAGKIPDNWAADGSLKAKVSKDMGPELDGDPGAMDALDVTVPLAEPDEMAPGDPADPGSPAWESIDAASAQKWLSVAARLENALCVLAEREMLEAASADPDDIENAWDLEDAKCAIEYAIERIAVFAAGEQAEAELGAEMESIGKALARVDVASLEAIEGYAVIAKSGRVLSSANEARIRSAAEALTDVLASLPPAPQAGEPVAKEKGAAMPATAAAQAPETVAKEGAPATPEEQARDAGPVNAGGTTGLGEPRMTGTDSALPGDGPQQARPGDAPGRTVIKALRVAVYDHRGELAGLTEPAAIVQRVAKADDGEKKPMQAVFDQDGDLIGIVDPDAIMPVTGAGAKPSGDGAMDGDGMQDGPAAAAAPGAGDMTPQPPADAGTPADEVGKAAGGDVITVTRDVLKSIVTETVQAALGAITPAQDVAKAADVAGALAEVEAIKARLETVEQQPAAPRVFTNGQVPPASMLRGQDQGGTQPVDVAKARALKETLYRGTAPEQNAAFSEMQQMAVDHLAGLQRR
jgi:hypothetical protein